MHTAVCFSVRVAGHRKCQDQYEHCSCCSVPQCIVVCFTIHVPGQRKYCHEYEHCSCCSVLQCAIVYCSMLQCVLVCCNVFHVRVAGQRKCQDHYEHCSCRSVSQCVTVCCSVLFYEWKSVHTILLTSKFELQLMSCLALSCRVSCRVLQSLAVCCNVFHVRSWSRTT